MLSKFFRSSPRNIRHRLLRDLVLLVLLTSGAIFTVVAIQGSNIRKDISRSLITQTTSQAEKEFRQLQESVQKILTIFQQWGKTGLLELKDIRALNAKFIPVLEQAPHVSSMMIADSDGVEFLLLRESDRWLTRSTGLGKNALWAHWKNAGETVAQWQEEIDYDPRTRPWYRGATETVEEGEVFWTRPYVFFTTKDPGVTGSIRWQRKEDKGKTFVVACDVLLNEIFRWVSEVRVSEKGKVFLLDRDSDVFAPREGGKFQKDVEGKEAYFVSPEELEEPAIQAAVTSWKKKGEIAGESLQFVSEGRIWWGGFSPLDSARQTLWIGVAVPESDFLGRLQEKRYLVSSLALAILAGGIVLAALVVRKYRHQLKEVPQQILSAGNLDENLKALLESGESSTLEFKSTMRMNLKSGKSGKEIELAWLKTVVAFLNTDGGTLLIGVSDDGEVVGLEVDEFRNEDKGRLHFKNLINQHIGVEFSKYLNFDIKALNGKSIAIIECERAQDPAFLKNNQDEDFYIRTGPSSEKLPVSKALKYLEARK